MIKNRDLANMIIISLLADMYSIWPKKVDFDYEHITKDDKFKDHVSQVSEIFDDTIDWLESNGYIIINQLGGSSSVYHNSFHGVVLTEKSLFILNGIPEGLAKSLGDTVIETAKDIGKETSKSAVSELIGSFIGHATRALLS